MSFGGEIPIFWTVGRANTGTEAIVVSLERGDRLEFDQAGFFFYLD